RAAQVRRRLTHDRRRIRPLLKSLISLRLEGASGYAVIAALRELEVSYREEWLDVYDSATSPVGYAWNTLIKDQDREAAFRAFEAATLWALRRGLRNGSLWLAPAEQYSGQHRILLPERRWAASRDAFLERRALPPTADEFIARTLAHLRAVDAAASAGELEILPAGRVVLQDDPAYTVERGDAQLLRTRLYARTGRV